METKWIKETEINNYIVYSSFWSSKIDSSIVHLYMSEDLSSFIVFCFSNSSFIEISHKDYSEISKLYNIEYAKKPIKQIIFEIADNICKTFCNWNN